MFEHAVFRRRDNDDSNGGIDIGLLAETLLFYGKVDLLLSRGNLGSLLRKIGPDALNRLASLPAVTVTFAPEYFVSHTENLPIPIHNFMAFTVLGKDAVLNSKQARIDDVFLKNMSNRFDAKKQSQIFSSKVEERTVETGLVGANFFENANNDLNDERYVREAMLAIIKERFPDFKIPVDWYFRPKFRGDGFAIETNLDFKTMSAEQKLVNIGQEEISTPSFLSEMLEARTGLSLSAEYNADVIVAPSCARLMQIKINGILSQRLAREGDISSFQSVFLGESRSVGETITSKQRPFSEFLDFLEKRDTSKFKVWLAEQNPSEALVRSYHNEVVAGTWIEKLPMKVLRFAFFSGLGIGLDLIAPSGLGTIVGIASGVGDSFMFDRLVKGWKPNQFVDGSLTSFTERKYQ